jgi:hypothetical protein
MTKKIDCKTEEQRKIQSCLCLSLSLSFSLLSRERQTNRPTEKREKRHLRIRRNIDARSKAMNERWRLKIEKRQRILLSINLTRLVERSATKIAAIWLHYTFLHYLCNQPYSIQSCTYPFSLVLKRMLICYSSKKTFPIKNGKLYWFFMVLPVASKTRYRIKIS